MDEISQIICEESRRDEMNKKQRRAGGRKEVVKRKEGKDY